VIILALDTSTRAGSVALMSAHTLLGWSSGDPKRIHGERLPGDLLTLLSAHETALHEVEAFAVCTGPGSFTGLRIGLATIQGLALATCRPVVAIPALEALAVAGLKQHPGPHRSRLVVPWMDAHRGEVFTAIYQADHDGAVTEYRPAAVGTTDMLLREWASVLEGSSVLFVGDAVDEARVVIEETLGAEVQMVPSMPPLAPTVARLAQDRAADTATLPHAIRPVYVRRPDAELARDRR